jgi:hypothetical protein
MRNLSIAPSVGSGKQKANRLQTYNKETFTVKKKEGGEQGQPFSFPEK